VANIVKHDVKADYYLPLLPNSLASLSLHLKAGLIWAFGDQTRIRVNDRYSLDSTFVRGYRGIGPGAPDILNPPPISDPPGEQPGGNVMGAVSASLNFPIPGSSVITGHCFANMGNLQYSEKKEEVFTQEYLQQFIKGAKSSVGVGMVFHVLPLMYGRLEFNAAFPLEKNGPMMRPAGHVFDRFKLGLQWSNT
jgi:outer membrane protein assembly factor BamA